MPDALLLHHATPLLRSGFLTVPHLQDAMGRRLENFTRVETFGNHQENDNNDVQWVKVLVDAHSREVFAYQPQIVPDNRIAVPAP